MHYIQYHNDLVFYQHRSVKHACFTECDESMYDKYKSLA